MPEEYPEPPVDPGSIAPAELARRIVDGEPVRLLDVRNRDEFETWHVVGPSVTATQLPFSKALQAQVTDSVPDLAAQVDGEGPITVVCARGESSAYVAGLFEQAGIEAHNLAEGMRGWARVYETHEITAPGDDGPTLLQYQRPSSGCLGYLLVSEDEAAVVDPLRAFTDRYGVDAADRGATVEYVIDTHVHADHVSGLRTVAEATGGEMRMSERARDRGVSYDVGTLSEDDPPSLGAVDLRAVPLPGHTTGMTGIAVGDLLLTGDSLFVESVARPDLEEGDEGAAELAAELYDSLQEGLLRFPDSMVVAPGHRDDGTPRAEDGTVTARLGTVRDRVEALSLGRDEFVDHVLAALPPQPNEYERIIETNLGRETLDDEGAFAVELGPNNCAAR